MRAIAILRLWLALSLPAAIPLAAWAADGVPADGKAKADEKGCPACHGTDGASNAPNIPNLAGQPDLFVQFQLVYFRNGTRKNEIMNPMAQDLSDQDVRNLGAYYASLPPLKAAPAADGAPEETALGEKMVKAGRCNNCHGDNLEGVDNIARLAGQKEEYLVKALQDFKSGNRTGGGMNVMVEVAGPMHEQEIKAMAHYLSRLP